MIATQASDNRLADPHSLNGVSNRNGNDTYLFDQVVISWEQGIPNINHLSRAVDKAISKINAGDFAP